MKRELNKGEMPTELDKLCIHKWVAVYRFPIFICLFLFSYILINNLYSSNVSYENGSSEKNLLNVLNLPEDIKNEDIIKLLDKEDKRILVVLLISYKQIKEAIPKLQEIFNNKNTSYIEKIEIAKTLCDFGNCDWLPEIKKLMNEPNKEIGVNTKLNIAGLLARGGDFNEINFVLQNASDEKFLVRNSALSALSNFADKTAPESEMASNALLIIALSNPDVWLRERAIYGIEKMANVRPEFINKLVQALEGNVDSNDKYLKSMSVNKLKILNDPNRVKNDANNVSIQPKPLQNAAIEPDKSIFSRPLFYIGIGAVCFAGLAIIAVQKKRAVK